MTRSNAPVASGVRQALACFALSLLIGLSGCGWLGLGKSKAGNPPAASPVAPNAPAAASKPPSLEEMPADAGGTAAAAAPLSYFPTVSELVADCSRTLADEELHPGTFRRGYCSASIVGLLGGFETAPFVLDIPRDDAHPSDIVKGYDLALSKLKHTVCPPRLEMKPDTVDDQKIAREFVANVQKSRQRDKNFAEKMSTPGIGMLHLFIFSAYACPVTEMPLTAPKKPG